jgi:hypothetical protein
MQFRVAEEIVGFGGTAVYVVHVWLGNEYRGNIPFRTSLEASAFAARFSGA